MFLHLFIARNSLTLKSVSWGSAVGKVQNQIFKTNSTSGETLNNFMFFFFRKGVRQAEEKASTMQLIESSIRSKV